MARFDSTTRRSYTGTWYGRGTPYSADECEQGVRAAFRTAKEKLNTPLYFGADEDAFFTDNPNDEGVGGNEDMIVVNEDHAVEKWWLEYATADDMDALVDAGFGPWFDKYGPGMCEY